MDDNNELSMLFLYDLKLDTLRLHMRQTAFRNVLGCLTGAVVHGQLADMLCRLMLWLWVKCGFADDFIGYPLKSILSSTAIQNFNKRITKNLTCISFLKPKCIFQFAVAKVPSRRYYGCEIKVPSRRHLIKKSAVPARRQCIAAKL